MAYSSEVLEGLQFKLVEYNSEEYRLGVQLRQEVLRTPLGRVFTVEELAKDETDVSVVGMLGATCIATAILVVSHDKMKMRQVAVAPSLQRSGIGSKLLHFCEEYVKSQGVQSIYCHARRNAVPFYRRNGYISEGAMFMEVGIEHLYMHKTFSNELK